MVRVSFSLEEDSEEELDVLDRSARFKNVKLCSASMAISSSAAAAVAVAVAVVSEVDVSPCL